MSLSVAHAVGRNRTFTLGRLAIEFPMNFYKYYIIRRHITGGVMGLQYAAIQSWFRVVKVYRLWRQPRTPHAQRRDCPGNEDEVTPDLHRL
jgi:hypothetical protein